MDSLAGTRRKADWQELFIEAAINKSGRKDEGEEKEVDGTHFRE